MIYVVMGVAGCGKTTVGMALAERLGGEFLDADPYHPPANVAKMSRGIPLSDEDRWGWLGALADLLRARLGGKLPTVLACSDLKESYRSRLRVSHEVRFIYLKGTFEVLNQRLGSRQGHFMKPGMLESQLATLEEPATGPGTDTVEVDITLPVTAQLEAILATFSSAN
jgi:gluconokinase